MTENLRLARNLWSMKFQAPEIVGEYSGAGQFVSILADDTWEHPLRRPMSIADVKGDCVSIIYKTVGAVTKSLARLQTGNAINVLGPLGNTFTGWDDENDLILVGGGVGLAPILNLYKTVKSSTVILGARTAEEHFFTHSPQEGVFLTTDDGSIGIRGTVIPTLECKILSKQNPIIFACGPEPMLKTIQNVAKKNHIPAQLSVESYMACGMGICQGCAIKKSEKEKSSVPTYHEKYDLVCVNGPVFSAEEISFD